MKRLPSLLAPPFLTIRGFKLPLVQSDPTEEAHALFPSNLNKNKHHPLNDFCWGTSSASFSNSLKMESYALVLFHSTPFVKPLRPYHEYHHHKTIPKFCDGKTLLLRSARNFDDRNNESSLWNLTRRSYDLKARAATIPGHPDEASKANNMVRTTQLGSMFAIWYLLNICFNIYNKQVLKVFPFPATVSAFQFGCGTVLVSLMWAFNLHPRPKINRSQLAAIFVLAAAHTVGNLLTNISLGKVAVSFTHTIKAMEPFFTVVLSALLIGEWPTLWVAASLLPIMGGVALASFTEASFNWIGFSSAMVSNLINQSRNVFSKKIMIKNEETLDNINLFSVITIISFILLVPAAIVIDGVKFSPAYLRNASSLGLNTRELCLRALLSGLCFHMYQQVSYMILQMVSPVTHAVGNCVKRVVVIVSSVVFFQTPVSPINSLGTALALAGVFLYSRAKRMGSRPKVS